MLIFLYTIFSNMFLFDALLSDKCHIFFGFYVGLTFSSAVKVKVLCTV